VQGQLLLPTTQLLQCDELLNNTHDVLPPCCCRCRCCVQDGEEQQTCIPLYALVGMPTAVAQQQQVPTARSMRSALAAKAAASPRQHSSCIQ
jgi:hypothetical protein